MRHRQGKKGSTCTHVEASGEAGGVVVGKASRQCYLPFTPSSLVQTLETKSQGPPPRRERPPVMTQEDREWYEKTHHYEYAPPPATPIETSFRHSGWQEARAKVRQAMVDCGVPAARLERFDACGSGCMVQREVGTDRLRVCAHHCHDRWCLPCAASRSRRVAGKLSGLMANRPARHVVLTLKHVHAPLREQFDRLIKCFAKLRRLEPWRSCVDGGAYFFEVKRSKCGEFYHPHLHVICCGRWMDRAELSAAWLKVTGDSSIVYIALIETKEKVVNYAAKYASKPFDPSVIRDPDSLRDAVLALRGRRLCSTFGEWRGTALEGDDSDQGEWLNVGFLGALVRAAAGGDLGSKVIVDRLFSRPKPSLVLSG